MIYCWCTDCFVHGSNSTGKKNDPSASRASDNHIQGVPGIKPDVRQSKIEGVLNCIAVSLSSMFLPSISPCYISVPSYYVLYFASCADVSRLGNRLEPNS